MIPMRRGAASPRPLARLARASERGAAAVEFVIMVPALLLMAGLMLFAGRLANAQIAVQQWADSAARTASLARDAGTAQAQAHGVVTGDARASGVRCQPSWTLRLDVSAFTAPLGAPGKIRAAVTCQVPVVDLLLPGLPGGVSLSAESSSTLDRYRGKR